MPIDFPLWYVRDLMIVVLCSPLLCRLIKCGRLLVGLIGGIWLSFNPEFFGIDMTGFFFFTLGGYFSMNKVDLADIFKLRKAKISTMFLFVIVIIADMITRGETYHYLLHNITILTGMIVMFICADLILRLSIGKSTILIEHFASTTFFVYALHGPVCSTFEKGTLSRFYNDIKYRSCYDLYAKYINNHYIESYYLLRVKKIMPTIL